MIDRPIIFSAPMIRALLAGRKSMTRRVIKPQPEVLLRDDKTPAPVELIHIEGDRLPRVAIGRVITRQEVRYAIGDRLWVREAWRTTCNIDSIRPRDLDAGHLSKATYEADRENRNPVWAFGRLRAAMHMPRWASRLTLTVTAVKVERLNDISEADAVAEGVRKHTSWGGAESYRVDGLDLKGHQSFRARDAFAALWESLHGPEAWTANPWVVAVSFETHRRNIDQEDAA